MKKLFSRMLCLMMVCVLAAGCTGCGDNTASTGDSDTPTITVFMPFFKGVGNLQPIIDEIEKQANVKLSIIDSADSDNGLQRAALIITTGEKVNWVNITEEQSFKKWGREGFINNLEPILTKHKDELPVLNMIVHDEKFKTFKGDNGEIYAIPGVNYIQNSGLKINRTWLDETGMAMPQTTDDVYRVLTKMRENHTNSQESPIYAAGLSSFDWAFLAHGGRLYSNGAPKYYKENGEYKPYDISDMNKEALKYVRKLYQDNLINQDWQIITSSNDVTSNFIGGRTGLIYTSANPDVRLYRTTGDKTADVPAPEGPTGIRSYGGGLPMYMLNVIPSSISDEKEIFNTLKFIEWMHSAEARKLCSFGVEGLTYNYNENGEIEKTDKYEEIVSKSNSGCGLSWGWVSPFPGGVDPKYGNVTDALVHMELPKVKQNDEFYAAEADDYMGDWIANINQYIDPYPYAGCIVDELKFEASATIENVDKFYTKAITEKDFDIDANWDQFCSDYMNSFNGEKCLNIFKEYADKYDK